MPRKASAKSLEYSSMFSFSRNAFISILKNSHYDYEKFCHIKDRINIYDDRIDLQVLCLSCRSSYHLTKECPYVTCNKSRYKPKTEFSNLSKTGIREKFNRKDRPIFNARIIRNEIEQKCEEFYQENYPLFEIESAQINPETPLLQINSASTKLRKISNFSGFAEDKEEPKIGEKKENETNINKKLMSYDTLEIKKLELDKFNFILEFEKAKNYELYFPHNNPNFVIKKIKNKI